MPNDYDMVATMQKQIVISAKKAKEEDIEAMEGGEQNEDNVIRSRNNMIELPQLHVE